LALTESAESGRLSVDLGAGLATHLRAYSEADRRSVDAVVVDAVEEYLDAHPNREQLRAEAAARSDRVMARSGGDQSGPHVGGPLEGRDV
jgi:hypothetical protein